MRIHLRTVLFSLVLATGGGIVALACTAKPIVVLVHHGADDWQDFAPFLERHGYRVILVKLPRHLGEPFATDQVVATDRPVL